MSSDNPPAVRNEEIQTLVKGFAVIKAFGPQTPKMTLAEVARATGLTRAGARRVLLTLRSLGYVSSDDKYFRLEPRVLELGYSYLASQPWWRLAQTVAERLADEMDTPVAAGVIDHDVVTYLAHARPRRFEAFVRSIGTKLPVSVSAMGRVLLAALPDSELEQRLQSIKTMRLTKSTVVDTLKLREAIYEVRELGYSIIDQELEVGLRSLAVPIRGRDGKVIAAIGMSSSDPQLSRDAFVAKYHSAMTAAADEISRGLAW